MADSHQQSLLPDASIDRDASEMPAFSLSCLPTIDAFASLGKLPSLDGSGSLAKLPSTDALDFLVAAAAPALPAANQPVPVPASLRASVGGVGMGVPFADAVPLSSTQPDDDATIAFSKLSPRAVAEAPTAPPPFPVGGPRAIGKRSGMMNSVGLASPDAEAKRLQHNRMVRENRERANRKFAALEALLLRCACADIARAPMRNKMQVLDRAMAQYPAMRARRALLRAQLVTSGGASDPAPPPPPPLTAPDTLARLLLAAHGWKAAEVWRGGRIHTALLAAKNMLATGARLRTFCATRAASDPDPLVARAANIAANVWVPDLRVASASCTSAEAAHKAGVSTALYVPLADAVVVLFHADDELLLCSAGVRPYEPDTLAAVDELARPLRIA